ncbi:hypothetical protein D9615_003949 [Tricholomella constricta]|uniref:Uncharacterized protein n=1 Tax=Tricholomella constricta TaxID=117010 RepID=A0A8H5HCS3_9AGAR|nr:hypothetical protein D9615_003949 [Tricholomella constricta]
MLKRPIGNQLHRIIRPVNPLLLHRCKSSGRTPWRQDTTPEPSVFVEENFAKHTLFVFDVGKRTIKFSLIGLFALGATAAAAYEATHLWVEHVELAPELDEEVKRWGWNDETEKWSGDTVMGGTDPALGFKGRHTVRAAWMAYNWGVGYSTAVIGSDAASGEGLAGPAGLRVIDASMQRTEDFLSTAISIAENRSSRGRLHPQTITQLVARHASVLERLGAQSLQNSKAEYERAWAGLSGQGLAAARIAVKLGDIYLRLGQASDAITWWSKAIRLTKGEVPEIFETLPTVLGSPPESPCAQRVLSTTLVSLSAFYAKSGQLRQAQAIEEAALDMLRSVRPLDSLASASPPHALHALYLLQRFSLLSTHLAEVLHAQGKPLDSSIQYLTSAAESSERVARCLTGHSLPTSGSPSSSVNLPRDASPLPVYTSSRSMKKTATSLLRDARRTSAEAWNLIGILNETQGKNLPVALQCYERAIQWAGGMDGKSETMQPGEGTLDPDWTVFWGNYTRAKRLVEQKT